MRSAFGVEHTVSKMVIRRVVKPKGKLVKLKTGTVNATHHIVRAGAGPTPVTIAARSIAPIRALTGH